MKCTLISWERYLLSERLGWVGLGPLIILYDQWAFGITGCNRSVIEQITGIEGKCAYMFRSLTCSFIYVVDVLTASTVMNIVHVHITSATCVTNEGLVLYIGGDCGLHLECYVTCTMLWAYVMCDMFAGGVMCDVRDAHQDQGRWLAQSLRDCRRNKGGGGAGVNHVKRDWLEIFNVNCDLYLFFGVKRDWGYLRETWSVIYIQRDPWLRHLFPRENDTNRPQIRVFKRYIINARYITSLPWRRSLPLFIGGSPELSLMITCAGSMYYGYHSNALQQWKGGGGDIFLWIINDIIFFLIKNNLSLLFLRKMNWR